MSVHLSVCLSVCQSLPRQYVRWPIISFQSWPRISPSGLGWVGQQLALEKKKYMNLKKNQILKKIFLVCKLLVCFCFCFRIYVCSAVISPFKMHVKNCCDSTIKKTYIFFQFQRLNRMICLHSTALGLTVCLSVCLSLFVCPSIRGYQDQKA